MTPAGYRERTIVKLRPDGSEAARYAGISIETPPGWVGIRAVWPYRRVDIGYFAFEPGDELDEFFSLERDYNAFAVYRDGQFVGWYCNVTYPTTVRDNVIYWHDLYLDVVVTPGSEPVLLDEDELADSGLERSAPDLHRRIVAAADELLAMIERREFPFSTDVGPEWRPTLSDAGSSA